MTALPGPKATIARLKKQVRKLVDEAEVYKSLLREGVKLVDATAHEVNGMGYETPVEDDWLERVKEAIE